MTEYLTSMLGILNAKKKCRTLRQQHFLVADCDKQGNLTKKEVFVQFVGVKSGDKITYILLCHGCNEQREGLLQVLLKNDIQPILPPLSGNCGDGA